MNSAIVINETDSDPGSLRDAVNLALISASPVFTITFAPNVMNIILVNRIEFNRLLPTPITININGNGTLGTPGGNPTITTSTTTDPAYRAFEIISNNIILNLNNFAISDTKYGAIRVGDSSTNLSSVFLKLDSMLMENNVAEIDPHDSGAAVINYGSSTLVLINSVFNNNRVIKSGGAISMIGDENTINGGTILIDGCTFNLNRTNVNNFLLDSGGGAVAILDSAGKNSIRNSTFSNNLASNTYAGAILANVLTDSFSIVNTTIANNNSSLGGGLYLDRLTGSPKTIINTTIYNNTARNVGGGIINIGIDPDANPIILSNTLIAKNTAPSAPDITGNFTGSTYNILSSTSLNTGIVNNVNNNQIIPNIDLTLSPLGNYGGARETVALLAGSPAINAGSNALIPGGILFDCRGTPFNRIVDGIVDIGAYEYNPIICYLGNSTTLTKDSTTGKTCLTNIKNITSDRHLVFDIITKKYVPVKLNIVTGPTDSIMLLKKNSLGLGTPSKDFYITSGHKIILGDREIKVRDIPRIQTVKIEPQNVYSICTENKAVILINNVKTLTWPLSEWTEYSKKIGAVWKNNSN